MAKDKDESPEGEDNQANKINKKLSPKVIMGDVKISSRLVPEKKTEIDLFQIMGIAGDTKHGESNFGSWTALLGQFRSVNLFTGEVMEAYKAFVPDVLMDMIRGKLTSQGPDARGVAFAFTVGIRLDDKSTIGYAYYAKPLVEASADDPMAKLIASVKKPRIRALTHTAAK